MISQCPNGNVEVLVCHMGEASKALTAGSSPSPAGTKS